MDRDDLFQSGESGHKVVLTPTATPSCGGSLRATTNGAAGGATPLPQCCLAWARLQTGVPLHPQESTRGLSPTREFQQEYRRPPLSCLPWTPQQALTYALPPLTCLTATSSSGLNPNVPSFRSALPHAPAALCATAAQGASRPPLPASGWPTSQDCNPKGRGWFSLFTQAASPTLAWAVVCA